MSKADGVGVSFELWVPTRGWPFCGVVERLNGLGVPYRFLQGGISIAHSRNLIVREFLQGSAEVLLMVDDDVLPPPNVLVLLEAVSGPEFGVVGGVVLTASKGTIHLPNVYCLSPAGDHFRAPLPDPEGPELQAVQAIGTGCLAVHRRVLTGMRAPFAFKHDVDGCVAVGEDLAFCERVRRRKIGIGAHYGVFCEHYDDVYAGGLAQAYMAMVEAASEMADG